MTRIKVGTVLVVSVLTKLVQGKAPTQFDRNDWKSIVNDVSEYAILQDNQNYSEFVFHMYEEYIRFYGKLAEIYAGEETRGAIVALADELHSKTECLHNGEITEVVYIENCMWISLEAIMKLLASASMMKWGDNQYTRFTEALVLCAFGYGRLMLFKQEQEILDMYLVSQYALDQALQEKYTVYVDELKKQSEQFLCMVDNAFVPNFREAFLNSIILAQTAGVSVEETLITVDDIDDFFMN